MAVDKPTCTCPTQRDDREMIHTKGCGVDARPERMVRGIKPGIAIVGHTPEDTGFASIRAFTFGSHGQPTVSVLELTRNEAIGVVKALTELLDA